MEHHITLPLGQKAAATLQAGDTVRFTGVLYTARDAAHKRMVALLATGQPLLFDVRDTVIYYVGPTPARPGTPIGSAGPTTSYRMDAYTPALLELGLRGMIGKGRRGPEVVAAMQRAGAVYFGAVGGAGALLSRRIKAAEVIAFEDLGPEAVHRLEVEDFPAVVVIDSQGRSLYESGPAAYRAAQDSPAQNDGEAWAGHHPPLRFQLHHIGVNAQGEHDAIAIAARLSALFDLALDDKGPSLFCGPAVEIMKAGGRGSKGHIAIATSSMPRALARLQRQGVPLVADSTQHWPDGSVKLVYLQEEIGGFAVHLYAPPPGG